MLTTMTEGRFRRPSIPGGVVMVKTVVGSFDSIAEAASAARDLRAAGFMENDVNVIANNQQRPFGREGDATTTDTTTTGERTGGAASGAATGIVAGGALGGAAGLAISLMGLAIP